MQHDRSKIDPHRSRPKLERDMLALTRNFRDTMSQFPFKVVDEKVLASQSKESRFKNTQSHLQSMETTDEMFNFKDGQSETAYQLYQPKSSLPEIFPLEYKPKKSRLRDGDLDWISLNWHKKNAQKLASKAAVSRDIIEMINLNVNCPIPRPSVSSKNSSARELSAHPEVPLNVNIQNLKTSFHSQSDAGIANNLVELEEGLNSVRQDTDMNKRSYRNTGNLVPLAITRNYRQPSSKKPQQGLHPYSNRLPAGLSISGLTASDFYLSSKINSNMRIHSGKSHKSQTSLRPSLANVGIEPAFETWEEYVHFEERSKVTSAVSHTDGLLQDAAPVIDIQEPTNVGDGTDSRDTPKNSDLQRRRSKRYQPKSNPLKVGYTLPSHFMLKNMQDEFSARKVVSAHPYKSYWLKCITECLDSDDLFQEEAGYYRVQPYRDEIQPKVEENLTETLDELLDWTSPENPELDDILETRKVMTVLWQKVALDTHLDEDQFKAFDLKRFGRINFEMNQNAIEMESYDAMLSASQKQIPT